MSDLLLLVMILLWARWIKRVDYNDDLRETGRIGGDTVLRHKSMYTKLFQIGLNCLLPSSIYIFGFHKIKDRFVGHSILLVFEEQIPCVWISRVGEETDFLSIGKLELL